MKFYKFKEQFYPDKFIRERRYDWNFKT